MRAFMDDDDSKRIVEYINEDNAFEVVSKILNFNANVIHLIFDGTVLGIPLPTICKISVDGSVCTPKQTNNPNCSVCTEGFEYIMTIIELAIIAWGVLDVPEEEIRRIADRLRVPETEIKTLAETEVRNIVGDAETESNPSSSDDQNTGRYTGHIFDLNVPLEKESIRLIIPLIFHIEQDEYEFRDNILEFLFFLDDVDIKRLSSEDGAVVVKGVPYADIYINILNYVLAYIVTTSERLIGKPINEFWDDNNSEPLQ